MLDKLKNIFLNLFSIITGPLRLNFREMRRITMEETRPINDERICRLNNEEKFFSLIEQRYRDQGYELLETCGPNQNK